MKRFLFFASLPLFLTFSLISSFASHASDQSIPLFTELEKKFPTHFNGFSQTNFPLVEKYRGSNLPFALDPETDASLPFQNLNEALSTLSHVKELGPLRARVGEILKDKTAQSFGFYILHLVAAAVTISEKTEEEASFFKLAGFSKTYTTCMESQGVIKDAGLSGLFGLAYNDQISNEKGDFYHRPMIQNFGDSGGQIESSLRKNPFYSINSFLLCTKPGEDILGLFYLAWCYTKGIHPVPVSLVPDSRDELHGFRMTPLGKICHDLAHSDIDPADFSVKQFTINILNSYKEKLSKNLEGKSADFKKQYGIKNMIPHVVEFASAVHTAYRQSLVDILEIAVKKSIDLSQEKLSEEFEAFSAGAFIQAHERSVDMSAHYATPDLHSLLKKSADSSSSENLPDPFSTSYITGETSLSDEEIFKIVIGLPRGLYQLDISSLYHLNEKLEEKEVSEFSVSRNKFYIEVSIDMVNGGDYLFRSPTNFTHQLNLKHDWQMLLPAREVLQKTYQYSLPTIPNGADYEGRLKEYEEAVRTCITQLEEGVTYLRRFFTEQAISYSHFAPGQGEGEQHCIVDKYALSYSRALRTLGSKMPPFIGDLQKFLSEEVSRAESNTLFT